MQVGHAGLQHRANRVAANRVVRTAPARPASARSLSWLRESESSLSCASRPARNATEIELSPPSPMLLLLRDSHGTCESAPLWTSIAIRRLSAASMDLPPHIKPTRGPPATKPSVVPQRVSIARSMRWSLLSSCTAPARARPSELQVHASAVRCTGASSWLSVAPRSCSTSKGCSERDALMRAAPGVAAPPPAKTAPREIAEVKERTSSNLRATPFSIHQ